MNKDWSPIEVRNSKKEILKYLSRISVFTGLCIVLAYIYIVSGIHSVPNNGEEVSFTKFGALGDFIAGTAGTLFSLAGVFLLYVTLQDQRESFERERLENNYFEMMKFHRENVNELTYSYYKDKGIKNTAEKRKVFKLIYDQFRDAFSEINYFFDNAKVEDIYLSTYISDLRINKTLVERNIDLKLFAQIDITYSIVFFGLSTEDKVVIKNTFRQKYTPQFITLVINYMALKPVRESTNWDTWEKISNFKNEDLYKRLIDKQLNDGDSYPEHFLQNNAYLKFSDYTYTDNYTKYYGGHQFRLGHYYRHLFQTVKFIDEEKHLTYNEKYKYVKILRGQLSNYEQIIFFLNSISQIGRTWELENKLNPKNSLLDNNHLITKYELIKNIPHEIIADKITVKTFYPYINYEAIINDELHKRKELILDYK